MQVSRNKSKYTGIKRLIYTTKWAIDGLIYAYKNEKSLLLHAALSVVGIILGIVLKINLTEWSIILISLMVILAVELINTAMEACVDMVTLEYNELARIAKDCCGAATLVMSLTASVLAGVIFIPKILALLHIA